MGLISGGLGSNRSRVAPSSTCRAFLRCRHGCAGTPAGRWVGLGRSQNIRRGGLAGLDTGTFFLSGDKHILVRRDHAPRSSSCFTATLSQGTETPRQSGGRRARVYQHRRHLTTQVYRPPTGWRDIRPDLLDLPWQRRLSSTSSGQFRSPVTHHC